MPTTSLVRLRCYWLIMGIEQSFARILVESTDVDDLGFLSKVQRERALGRLKEDFRDEAWTLEDVTNEDLLTYLDLGDLLQ
jgi:hypothetical protein